MSFIVGASALTRNFYNFITPYRVFNVQCSGNETKLSKCQHTISHTASCSSNRAVLVSCQLSK